jgi:nitroreductase
MTKDVFAAIFERRSVRSFTHQEVPLATVTRLLEAAAAAPSAGNVQPWKFFVVEDADTRKELARAALNQAWMADAPVVIVVCADLARAEKTYGERGRTLYALQDTAAAAQNILLGATALGLGTCWVGAFNERMVAAVFDLETQLLRPVAMIPLGHPAKTAKAPARRPAEDIMSIIKGGS